MPMIRDCRSLLLLLATLIVTASLALRSSVVQAAGDRNSELAGEADVVPSTWTEVPAAQLVPVLQMLATQTRGNFERIQTWQATYAYESEQRAPRGEVAGIPPDLAGVPMRQKFQYQLEIVVDFTVDAIRRSKLQPSLTWLNAETNQVVEVPKTGVPVEVAIVKGGECLHMQPERMYGAFQAVPDHPKVKNKRAAFRDAIESQKGAPYAAMPDPRRCFGRSDKRKFWEELGVDLRTLAGEFGDEKAALYRNRLQLFEASSPEGTWYREDVVLDGPGGQKHCARTIWSAEAGFHPVRFSLWLDEFGGHLLMFREWRFKEVDGIYVPDRMKEATYVGDVVAHDKSFELTECVLNEPIDPSQFDYVGSDLRMVRS